MAKCPKGTKEYTFRFAGKVLTEKELGSSINKSKALQFNYLSINKTDAGTQAIKNLFSNKVSEQNLGINSIKGLVNRVNIKDKLGSFFNTMNTDIEVLNRTMGSYIHGRNAIQDSIAMSHILRNIANEDDVIEKVHLTKEERAEIKNKETGRQTTGTARSYAAIGRAILEADGFYRKGQKLDNEAEYLEIGELAVKRLKEKGLVDIQAGKFIAHGIVNPDNRNVTKSNSKLLDGQVISISKKIVDEDIPLLSSKLTELGKIITPARIDVPLNESSNIREALMNDVKLTPNMRTVIQALQKSKFEINPHIFNMLKDLKDIYNDQNRRVSFLKKIKSDFSRQEDFLRDVIGINMEELNSIFDKSNKGKEISRTTPLIQLMEHLDKLKGDIYLTYFMANNTRLFQAETVLNNQTDKNMSRNILQGEAVLYKSSEDTQNFLERLSEETGLPIEIIKDRTNEKGTKRFKEMFSLKGTTIEKMVYISEHITELGMTSKKPYEIFRQLEAIQDVRNGNDVDGFKSAYMFEVDATASGLLIKMLQEAYSKTGQTVINRLNSNEMEDAYNFALEKFAEFAKMFDGVKATMSLDKKPFDEIKQLMTILGNDITSKKSMRDFVKMPIMTFQYGQGAYNNQVAFGETVVKQVMEENDVNKLNELIKLYNKKLEIKNEYTKEEYQNIYDTLVMDIAETSGKFMVEKVLEPVYKKAMFNKTSSELSTISEVLALFPAEERTKAVTHILPPNVMLEMKEKLKENETFKYEDYLEYRVPLDKKKEILHTLENGKLMMVKEFRPNPTSMEVLPVHMIDSAVLTRTLYRYYRSQGKEVSPEAIIPIHDAIMSNGVAVKAMEQIYREELLTVNRDYSIIEALLMEVKYKMSEHPDVEIPIKAREEINRLENEIEDRIKEKKKYFDETFKGNQTLTNSFGRKGEYDANSIEKAYEKRTATQVDNSTKTTTSELKNHKKLLNRGDNRVIEELIKNKESYVILDTETTGIIKAGKLKIKNIPANYKGDHTGATYEVGIVRYTYNKETKSYEEKEYGFFVNNINLDLADQSSYLKGDNKKEQSDIVAKIQAGDKIINGIPVKSHKEATRYLKELLDNDFNKLPIIAKNSSFDSSALKDFNVDYGLLDYNDIKIDSYSNAEGLHNAVADVRETNKMIHDRLINKNVSNINRQFNYDNSSNTPIDKTKSIQEVIDSIKDLEPQVNRIKEFIKINNKVIFEDKGIFQYEANQNLETIRFDSTKQGKEFVEKVIHEIEHAETVSFLADNKNDTDVKYIKRVMQRLKDSTNERIQYALNKSNELEQVAEFVAIVRSESDVRNYLSNKFSIKTLMDKIKSIISKLTGINFKSLKDNDINVSDLFKTLDSINNKGRKYKKTKSIRLNFEEFDKIKYTPAKPENSLIDMFSRKSTDMNKYVADIIDSGLIKVAPASMNTFKEIDKWAMDNLFQYAQIKDVLTDAWENNEQIQGLRTWAFNKGELTSGALADLNAMWHKATNNRNTRLETTAKELTKLLSKSFNKDEISHINDVFAVSGIFSLISNGMLEQLGRGVPLSSMIKSLESEVKSDKTIARNMSNYYQGKDISDSVNLNFASYNLGKETQEKLEALTSLYVIQDVDGTDIITKLHNDHPVILNQLINLSSAVKNTHNKVIETVTDNEDIVRGNLITDVPLVAKDIVVVTMQDLKGVTFNTNNGWEVIRQPDDEKGIYGLVARQKTSLIQEGLGTNVSQIKNNIRIPKRVYSNKHLKNKNNNFVIVDGTKQLYLTKKDKELLGYHSDPVTSLLRAYAHNELILESQTIRDTLLAKFTEKYGETRSKEDLLKDVEKDEHPVFLKLPTDTRLEDLPSKLANKYVQVESNILSDIKGFKSKVDIVRKDVAYQVTGYTEVSVFDKHYGMNKFVHNMKEIIKYAKVNMLVVNPIKIAKDLISNYSYLASRGVSIGEMMKYSKEAIDSMKRFTDKRNKLIDTEFKYRIKPTEALKKEIEKQQKDIENDSFSPALAHGFLQSLSTEMLAKDSESISGIAYSMNRVLTKVLKNDADQANILHNAIMRASKIGGSKLGVETLYEHIGGLLDKVGSHKIAEVIKYSADRMKEIKTKEDSVKYMEEILLSPNSSIIKGGGAMTLYADLLPRWTLYRHLVNIGMNEKEAGKDALTSFLDYKVNMPRNIKFLSDTYMLPFPTFFLRIQRIIANLMRKNTITFGTSVLINEVVGIHGTNIVNSNIFEKDSIITSPTDIISPSNLIPYSHLF